MSICSGGLVYKMLHGRSCGYRASLCNRQTGRQAGRQTDRQAGRRHADEEVLQQEVFGVQAMLMWAQEEHA